MQVTHNLGILSVSKNINDNAGFLLTNKNGGYCSFFNKQDSRYHGLFYFDKKNMEMYKSVENIEVIGHDGVSNLKNGFYYAERKKDDLVEFFSMPKSFSSLIYELSSEKEIDLVLDCKKSYDNREWGRFYEIYEENGALIVKFTKKTDRREDSSDGNPEFTLFVAIKRDSQKYVKNEKWVERNYAADQQRNSLPFKRHAYNALRLIGTKFVFSISGNKNSALKEAEHVFNNLDSIKNKEKENFLNILKNNDIKKIITNGKLSDEIKIAHVNAANSLSNLVIDKPHGVIAGLPWFYQFWPRDTFVAIKSLSKINNDLSEKIIFYYLDKISSDGRFPNLVWHQNPKNLGSADAIGWLFLRCKEVIEKINANKKIINSIKDSINTIKQNKNSKSPIVREYIRRCNSIINKKEEGYHKVVYEIESSLEKSINGLLKFHTKDNFESNEPKETWMDTDYANDCRDGVRIEIQALRLKMYKLMFELSQNHKYKILEHTLRIKLRHKFWNGKILADGLNDFTARPNVFIAAYVYQELLSKKEWEECLDNLLAALWREWGGLSTIDKNNGLFTDTDSGEDVKSYHRGNSWFWINNLAALVLNRTNGKKFSEKIKKIIEASTDEILWKGCVGCHSELSSAKELTSSGCFSQAWSNAMYMEMIEEVFG